MVEVTRHQDVRDYVLMAEFSLLMLYAVLVWTRLRRVGMAGARVGGGSGKSTSARWWTSHQAVFPLLIFLQSLTRVLEALLSVAGALPQRQSFNAVDFGLAQVARAFYFSCNLLLLSVWARIYHQVFVRPQELAQADLRVRTLNLLFNALIAIGTLVVVVLAPILHDRDQSQYSAIQRDGQDKFAQLISWNQRCVGLLSLMIALGFLFYGLRGYRRYQRVSTQSNSRLKQQRKRQTGWTTVVCVLAFLFRACIDCFISTEFGQNAFGNFPLWIYDIVFYSVTELVPGSLMLAMVDPDVKNVGHVRQNDQDNSWSNPDSSPSVISDVSMLLDTPDMMQARSDSQYYYYDGRSMDSGDEYPSPLHYDGHSSHGGHDAQQQQHYPQYDQYDEYSYDPQQHAAVVYPPPSSAYATSNNNNNNNYYNGRYH